MLGVPTASRGTYSFLPSAYESQGLFSKKFSLSLILFSNYVFYLRIFTRYFFGYPRVDVK